MPDYYDGGGAGVGAIIALVFLILPVILIFSLAGYLISSFFYMRLFDKAGVEGKWRAWVPIYREMVFAKLGDLSPWVMLGALLIGGILGSSTSAFGIGFILYLLPVAAIVMASWRVGLKLGKDWPLLLLYLIAGIGNLIWLGIAALSSAPWNPRVQPSPWRTSFLRDTTVWQGIPVQPDGGAAPAPGGYAAPNAGSVPPPAGSPYAAPGAYPPPATPPQQSAPPTTEPPAPDAPRP